MSGPYFSGQQSAECGHYYPDVLRLRDEQRPDGTVVRVIDCRFCGQYELPLAVRTLDPEIVREIKETGRSAGTDEANVAKVRQAALERLLRGGHKRPDASPTLASILDNAIRQGIDAIELEYGDEGLEVSYFRGHMGLGEIIRDRNVAARIIKTLVSQAKLSNKTRGTLRHEYQGKPYEIGVVEEDRFGESAFRLTFGKTRRGR